MESPENLFQLLEIAAVQKPSRGLVIDIPSGLERELTTHSDYEVKENDENEDEYEQEEYDQEDNVTRKEHDKYSDSADDANWTKFWNLDKKYNNNLVDPKNEEKPKGRISYSKLLQQTKEESSVIEGLMGMINTRVILIYTNNDLDRIHWFWAVICAGGVPCLCTKLPEDPKQRATQIDNLKTTLKDPIILTSRELAAQFKVVEGLRLYTFYSIEKRRIHYLGQRPEAPTFPLSLYYPGYRKQGSDLAVIMLTSGSTGNPKAVSLTHSQILSSLRGKSEMHGTTFKDVFLNCKISLSPLTSYALTQIQPFFHAPLPRLSILITTAEQS